MDPDGSTTILRRLLDAPDDPARWQAIVAHYGPWVRRWVRSRVARDDVADELTNDLFLKIYLNLGSLRADHGGLRPWISTVIFRQIQSWGRTQKRDRLRAFTDIDAAALEGKESVRELEDMLDTAEYADRYQAAIHQLRTSSGFRPGTIETFLAQVRDGKSPAGAGREAGVSASAAVKHKFRVARAVVVAMGLPDDRESLGLLCRLARMDATPVATS